MKKSVFNLSKIRKKASPEDPMELEMQAEEAMMHTDPLTGKQIHYIRKSDVEKVLNNFIVDTLSGATLSKRFALDFDKSSGEFRSLVAMRLVSHPYTRYNISPDLRRGIMGAIKDNAIGDLQEIMAVHEAESLKKPKSNRPKRTYNPNRPRRTRYPVTRMQEIRDMHGMVGLYDLSKAKNISEEINQIFGQYFSHRELDLIKSVALTNAYINIYPEKVAVIRGNGKMWLVDDSTYEELAQKGMYPEFD